MIVRDAAGMEIRPEQPGDAAAIRAVHAAAFAGDTATGQMPDEVGLVDALRATDAWLPAFSLVAVHEGEIVGHCLTTRAHVGATQVLGLGLDVPGDHDDERDHRGEHQDGADGRQEPVAPPAPHGVALVAVLEDGAHEGVVGDLVVEAADAGLGAHQPFVDEPLQGGLVHAVAGPDVALLQAEAAAVGVDQPGLAQLADGWPLGRWELFDRTPVEGRQDSLQAFRAAEVVGVDLHLRTGGELGGLGLHGLAFDVVADDLQL